jgi:uncharacterized protein involved in oxidation of intracellular sulfur
MSKYLFILNEAAYGNERSYNALRLAGGLSTHTAITRPAEFEVRIFLLGDAVSCTKRSQKVPQGFYNIEHMIEKVVRHQGQVSVCGSCMDARGITPEELAEGCHRSSLVELTVLTDWADKVLAF